MALLLFYVYFWLRYDGTPYYVGKGSGGRCFYNKDHTVNHPTKDRILIQYYESEKEAFEAEIFFIAYYGRKDLGTGCLHNRTDGGENPPKSVHRGFKHSEETRRKLSIANKGKKLTEETRSKMSRSKMGNTSARGHVHSQETRERISKSNLGKVMTENNRLLLLKANTGRVYSAETRHKMSVALKGKVPWNKGRKFS